MTNKVGDKFETRDGQTATIHEIIEGDEYPLRGLVNSDSEEWRLDGSYDYVPGRKNPLDLIIPPEPVMTTIERDKIYKMRGGLEVLIKAVGIEGPEPILGVVKGNSGRFDPYLWRADEKTQTQDSLHDGMAVIMPDGEKRELKMPVMAVPKGDGITDDRAAIQQWYDAKGMIHPSDMVHPNERHLTRDEQKIIETAPRRSAKIIKPAPVDDEALEKLVYEAILK